MHFTSKDKQVSCGVPVKMWVEVVLFTWIAYSIVKLSAHPILKYKPEWKLCHTILITSIYTLATTGWTIYGAVLLFNKKNTCMQSNSENVFFGYIMLVLIVLGFIRICLNTCILSCYGCFYCCLEDMMRNPEDRDINNDQVNIAMGWLTGN